MLTSAALSPVRGSSRAVNTHAHTTWQHATKRAFYAAFYAGFEAKEISIG